MIILSLGFLPGGVAGVGGGMVRIGVEVIFNPR